MKLNGVYNVLRKCKTLTTASIRSAFQTTLKSKVEIAVPEKSPVDENVAILVSGFQPKQPVTFRVDASRHGVTMSSFAKFEASSHGDVDLTRDSSLGGTYNGKEPMGLFWSMQCTSESKVGMKMLNGRLDSWPCSIRVYDGHVDSFHHLNERTPLGERTIHRMFLSDGTRRERVRYKTLRGLLFLPDPKTTPPPYPGIIEIYGSYNLLAHRGPLLARQGYAVLSVAFGGYEDLPAKLDSFDMGYFVQSFQFMKEHPEVDGDRIGSLGQCLGGTLSLALAREVGDGIRAISCVAPEPFAEGWDYYFPSTGEWIRPGKLYSEPCIDKDGSVYQKFKQIIGCIRATGSIDNWRKISLDYGRIKDAPIMMFYGAADIFFEVDFTVKKLRQQFADRKKENYEIVLYEGAGHIIQPPNLPMFDHYYSPLFEGMLHYGGVLPYHAHAQQDMWKRVLAFFKSHLKDATPNDYKTGPRPVHVRRNADGNIIDSTDLNCQFRYLEKF